MCACVNLEPVRRVAVVVVVVSNARQRRRLSAYALRRPCPRPSVDTFALAAPRSHRHVGGRRRPARRQHPARPAGRGPGVPARAQQGVALAHRPTAGHDRRRLGVGPHHQERPRPAGARPRRPAPETYGHRVLGSINKYWEVSRNYKLQSPVLLFVLVFSKAVAQQSHFPIALLLQHRIRMLSVHEFPSPENAERRRV